jgi:TolB protein
MKSDGSGRSQLTEGNGNERNPAWAPDGSTIAYSSDRNGRPEIMLINTDGSAQRLLGITAVIGSEPTWSLDGRKIAFQRDNDIYTVNSSGQELKQVTHDRSSTAPAWSPDGALLSFVSRRSGNAEIYVADIYDVDISQFRLTNDVSDDTAPTWSPDGSKLAFVSTRSGSAQVYEIQADASGLVRLTNNSSDSKPAWSPYIRPRAVLGNQGIFGKRASGVLFARSHDSLSSIVVFDALSPNSTRVVGQPNSNIEQPNLTFTVVAEGSKLNRVVFLNGEEISPTVVVGAGSTIPTADGVMIDFDSEGRITAVIPFNN